ncbi:OPT family oligopeptide transporter [Phenylobacterium deserti]|uniref:Oligopeptide transporter, OPT family n=1 Tax=Phenylobacterium deserti TaxID=1914756 RepID=A0A328AC14_9CAUL|nr:oligopeptide transporter, OPT family [Phenylobacterium deserti]RAK52343.1 oligopeptide transporter, OPT family [Phenylobacterium deserti]
MAAVETADRGRVELTVRGIVLGVLITLVFTAANVYLGLRVGLTFASSIPAAVISMALLRAFKNSSIYENNIVQTVASAAGAMASVIFVLPGLVMIGAWTGFPFWTSFGICAIGGVLGVMYTIPLRRALVTQSDLPYPEGVAAAEVLKVGSGSRADTPEAAAEGKQGLIGILLGSVASALYAALTASRVFAAEIAAYFRIPTGGVTGLGGSASLALFGAGHLMGMAVGMAMLTGLIIAWGFAVPILSTLTPAAGPAADVAGEVWSTKVRFIGAGAIGVAAIWTLAKLIGPVGAGLTSAVAAQRQRRSGGGALLGRTEQDMPIGIVGLIALLCLVPMAILIMRFLAGGPLASVIGPLTLSAMLYVVIAGFAVAAVCGYMAGLIGSSNSPVSGMAILAVLGAAVLTAVIGRAALPDADTRPLVAFALLVTGVLLAVAVAANDNLQDLKTGQLVDATPWRQQAALVVGVVAGSAMIPPILELLNKAYGFAGAPNSQAIAADPLPAPQATLISTLAKGVIDGQLDWGLIGVGGLIGVVLVATDAFLRRGGKYSLPPLGVGMAIYLPVTVTAPVVIGAVSGWIFDRTVEKRAGGEVAKRLGVLVVSGFIVGESLFNVALAGLIVGTGNGAPLALAPEGFGPGVLLALVGYIAVAAGVYAWAGKRRAA